MKVLCFGSLNIDYTYTVPHFVRAGETLSASALRLFAGGKGLNQAIALSRAGLPVSLAGSIGTDGEFLLEELHRAGVDTRHIDVLPDVRTGHAIIQNDAAGDNCILVYGGANHRTSREQIDRVLRSFGEGDVLTMQNEIRELEYLIREAKARGMTLAFTPAPMNASVRALPLELIDYLFLNRIEAGVLLETEVGPRFREAAEALRERYGIRNVVLTLGGDGSVLAGESGCFVQAAIPTEPVDTTGAGDTYAGFFLGGILNGFEPQRAMLYASAAASIAITRRGASASIPARDEVLAAMDGKA